MPATSYFMYLRKSSESEDRQQLSLDAQEDALNRVVADRGLHLVAPPIREAKSAKRPGRPEFNAMMEAIAKGKARGILCWNLDRLARNPIDGGRVIWALDTGELDEIITPTTSFAGNPDDKMMMHIHFGMAQKYIGDLGRNVKRGNEAALKAGLWPQRPKIGYIRDVPNRDIIPDPERFHRIRDIWSMRLAGIPAGEILRIAREEWGLRAPAKGRRGVRRGNSLISSSQLYRILHDPFYTGIMVHKGERFPGRHKPMITYEEFLRVQSDFTAAATLPEQPRNKYQTEHRFVYQGLIRCGACSAAVTAEHKRQRHGHEYVYYHCCRKRRTYRYCPEPSAQERDIDEQLAAFLHTIRIPEAVQTALLAALDDELQHKAERAGEDRRQAEQRIAEYQRQVDSLRGMCSRGIITEADFVKDRARLEDEIQILRSAAERRNLKKTLLEPVRDDIFLTTKAISAFNSDDPAERRSIVQSVVSNLLLHRKKLYIQPKRTFAVLRDLGPSPSKLAVRRASRTLAELPSRIRDTTAHAESLVCEQTRRGP